MSYKKAKDILPPDLLRKVQNYIDGEAIYVPRLSGKKRVWGSNTSIRKELEIRNKKIYADYQNGKDIAYLTQKYYLSLKSIQRIIRNQK